MSWEIRQGDALEQLREMPDESVQCCVTSPPYWGLRDYGVDGQMGLESTPEEYVDRLVAIFAEVRRVLRDDGTLWLNLGDSYAATSKGSGGTGKSGLRNDGRDEARRLASADESNGRAKFSGRQFVLPSDLKPKDLIGVPWMLAFALRAEGWYLRRDIIWSKPNPMPESVTDRPTSAHEYLFLLSKSPRYFYDAEAIREPSLSPGPLKRPDGWATEGRHEAVDHSRRTRDKQRGHGRRHDGFNDRWDAMSKDEQQALGRNKRSVWTIATRPYPDAHFATFPPDLVEPCILAGSPGEAVVLDPFAGAATTGLVATRLDRDFIGIELNPEYVELGEDRIRRWEANPNGHLTGDAAPLEGQLALEAVQP